ncbi:hypothetical protein AWN76_002755 [Rhodothermaceae bacterium RA]|nr:hypothetical protein AWN76_002755 [Rhodothermaceae bacterium RA]
MHTAPETWTQSHDLALLFLAIAYGTDQSLSDEEVEAIETALTTWPSSREQETREIVMEALAVHLEEGTRVDVTRAMVALKRNLSPDERCKALTQAVRVAEADGVILAGERDLILKLAEAWEVKATGARLLEQTTAAQEALPDWSLLHDIALIYLVMAHSTDNELNEYEIAAIVERLQGWQPELPEADVRDVLRAALRFYATEPDEDALRRSLTAIRDHLPLYQRLALLNDLIFIAEADSRLGQEEKRMFESLSRALGYALPADEGVVEKR